MADIGIGIGNRMTPPAGVGMYAAFDALYRQATWSTGDALTNTRAGARKTVINPIRESLANTVPSTTISGLTFAESMCGYTNILSATGTDYEKFEGGTGTVDLTQTSIVCTHLLSTDRTFAADTTVNLTAGESYTVSCNVTLNTLVSSKSVITVENNGAYTIQPGETGIINYSFVAVSTETVYVRFGHGSLSAGPVGSIAFTDIRLVDAPIIHPAMPNGSAAGATVATDIVAANIPWTQEGTRVDIVQLYGWDVSTRPNSAPRVYENSTIDLRQNSSTIRLKTAVESVSISNPLSPTAISVVFTDHDGVELGLQADKGSRSSVASTVIPSGISYEGNRGSGTRELHGYKASAYFPWVLTTAERSLIVDATRALVGGSISTS